jgi:hypothetical protein
MRYRNRIIGFVPSSDPETSSGGDTPLPVDVGSEAASDRIADAPADRLRRLLRARENEHLEFKEARNNFHFDKLVKYCAALANEGGGSIVLGVGDKRPRRIVGSHAFEGAWHARRCGRRLLDAGRRGSGPYDARRIAKDL